MKSPKRSSIILTPEEFVDRFLENLKVDLYRACCTTEDCDGWHPIQDEEDDKTMVDAKKELLDWYKNAHI